MQQWEYRIVRLYPVPGFSNIRGWRVREISGRIPSNWRKGEMYSSIESFCNQMGLQGWELVSAGNASYNDLLLSFKRPLETPDRQNQV